MQHSCVILLDPPMEGVCSSLRTKPPSVPVVLHSHGIIKSLKFGNTSKIVESNLWLNITASNKPEHQGPHWIISWTIPGVVTPPGHPSSQFQHFKKADQSFEAVSHALLPQLPSQACHGSYYTLLLYHGHTDPGTLQTQAGKHTYKKYNTHTEDFAQKSEMDLAGCRCSHRTGVWVWEEGQEDHLFLSCRVFLLFIFHYGEITFGG